MWSTPVAARCHLVTGSVTKENYLSPAFFRTQKPIHKMVDYCVVMNGVGLWNVSLPGFSGNVVSCFAGNTIPKIFSALCSSQASLSSENNFEISSNRLAWDHSRLLRRDSALRGFPWSWWILPNQTRHPRNRWIFANRPKFCAF